MIVLLSTFVLNRITYTPWGRVLRAIREDEDAARALGKNTIVYKLQSLTIAALLGSLAGLLLALNLKTLHPAEFEPLVTFFAFAVLILGGLASYRGSRSERSCSGSCSRGPATSTFRRTRSRRPGSRRCGSRSPGALLIGLMAFRPQGIFGKKEEMVLGE